MKYQLVLQWPCSSTADHDWLIRAEDLIRTGLQDIAIVDGHDYGSGEMNIFVHTDEPQRAFEAIKNLLARLGRLSQTKAGYRDFEEDNYKPIYPVGLRHFSVI
jgi:hypothetical protein